MSVSPAAVLLAWAKAKGVVVVTSSSKESRLRDYLAAGDLSLNPEDLRMIDIAGAQGADESASFASDLDKGKTARAIGADEKTDIAAQEQAEAGGLRGEHLHEAGYLDRRHSHLLLALCFMVVVLVYRVKM
jgi:hypothetical protein